MSDTYTVRLKGVSPLVATVLLIAFVVAVAGIIATWVNSFATSQTQLVGQQSTTSITCSYGHVAVQNMVFQSASTRLAGTVVNTGTIAQGNISVSIVSQNATSQNINLCNSPSGSTTCTVANLSLAVSDQVGFNFTISGSNYDNVKVKTNCSSVGVTAQRGDITSS